tara:strand:+ start:10156 stop:10680 length:525 start_codon:yes stop_codon:yes gene_type:complete
MVVITIPNNKPPKDEIGAVEFAKIMSDTTMSEYDFHYNDNHTEIIDVETFAGKNTQYVKEFYQKLKQHPIHINLRSYDVEDDLLKKYDVVVAYFAGLTDMNMVDALVNTLSEVCVVDKVEAEYSTHRLSLVSETLFDKPSIILYLNEGAIDLYSAVAEELVKFLLERPVVQRIG